MAEISQQAHRFWYNGGSYSVGDNLENYKFHLFAVLEDKEHIFFEALKQGIISRGHDSPDEVKDSYTSGASVYVCRTPEVKIFLSSQGFGVRKAYYTFFFRFDRNSGRVLTILPFGPNTKNYVFRGRGRFMTRDEIMARFPETSDTRKYYERQTYLSTAELRNYVKVTDIEEAPISVRVVRV